MIIPVSVKNQSIDSSGITSDYKACLLYTSYAEVSELADEQD